MPRWASQARWVKQPACPRRSAQVRLRKHPVSASAHEGHGSADDPGEAYRQVGAHRLVNSWGVVRVGARVVNGGGL
jgi:hypothetical protein